GTTGDKNGITRITSHHDHLIAAKKRGHGIGSENLSLLQVGDGVKSQCASHPSNRIKVNVLDVTVLCQESANLFVSQRSRPTRLRHFLQPEPPHAIFPQKHFS